MHDFTLKSQTLKENGEQDRANSHLVQSLNTISSFYFQLNIFDNIIQVCIMAFLTTFCFEYFNKRLEKKHDIV